jgi:tocopherol cyclase
MRIFLNLKNIWRPSVYRGHTRKKNYFEGWYFKLVDHEKSQVIAVIPGIFQGSEQENSHAFIQILDSYHHQNYYFRFPVEQFNAAKSTFDISIADNHFSTDHLILKLEDQGVTIRADLAFNELHPWPVKRLSPGAMGPYAFAPFMQCNHAVISMDHHIQGQLIFADDRIDFNQGRGYMEKDWGSSFPEAYVWLQCNHFEQQSCSIFVSVAKVPWVSGAFRGFIIGLLFDGQLYRFATYTGAQIDYLRIHEGFIELQVSDKRHRLWVRADRQQEGLLLAPYDNDFIPRVAESLTSTVAVEFYVKEGAAEKLLWKGKGYPAALDVNGRLQEIAELIP